MEVTSSQHGDVQVFHLDGRLAVAGMAEFEQQVLQAIDAGAKRVVFVVTKLTYISSAGLRVFFVALKRLGNDTRRMCVCDPQPAVRKVMDISGLTRGVPVLATLADALALPLPE